MPNVNDIISVAEALEKCPIAVAQDSCVVVRNRNATCRRCVNVCAAHAITVCANKLTIDASACVGCGACASVCPTEALVALQPSDRELSSAALEATAKNDGRLVVACARISSKRAADPTRYAEVACLPRVDESLILSAIAQGATEALLVDGDCATCKYRDCTSRVNAMVTSLNELLAGHNSPARVTRVTGFPDDMLIESARGMFGTTRRGFFSEAASAAKDTALTAAQVTIAQDLGYTHKTPEIGERLRITEGGTLPLVSVPKHELAINSLDAIGQPVVEDIDSRLFATISIDTEKCNACGMCAMFCPTGALKRDQALRVNADVNYLEFSAADCVQCDSCADVCWKGALTVSPVVAASELYDFEPVTFDLSRSHSKKPSLFGKTR